MRNTSAFAYLLLTIYICALVLVTPTIALASTLSSMSDTLSNPAPSELSNHTIRFTTISTIPVSGKIVISPSTGNFNIPTGLDYTDLDVKVNNVDKTLSSSPGTGIGSSLGVSVVSGSSGSITITLNNTDTIPSNSQLLIDIGTTAVYGSAGDVQIYNPSSEGSYTISIITKNAANTTLDNGTIGLSINNPVGVSSEVTGNTVATPTISPSGGNFTTSVSVTISTTTNGASIYYTTDGSTPTSASSLYTSAITISSSITLKAIAILSSYTDSNIASALFTVSAPGQPSSGGGGAASSYVPPSLNKDEKCNSPRADLNCDGKVNLADFSILMYYWNSRLPNIRADINKDGIVNLIDFSILLYFWSN